MEAEIIDKIKNTGLSELLLGNEAIAQGALESGIGYATIYPGTPISEIGTCLEKKAAAYNLIYEVSINEKVALEAAIGASLSGVRSLVAMKHVGLNVASDPLMTLAYIGTEGGLVIVSGDDPGCYSSQNEQDNRLYSIFSNIPMFEPSNPSECREMVKEAFVFSEKYKVPVILRTTTAVNHARGFVDIDTSPCNQPETAFSKNTSRFVPIPFNARRLHKNLVEKISGLEHYSSNSAFNYREGSGDVGIITSGACYTLVNDCIAKLSLSGRVSILKLGVTHPLPHTMIVDFLSDMKQIIVIEELKPYLENAVRVIAQKEKIDISITGKSFANLAETGDYSIDIVEHALKSFFNLGVNDRIIKIRSISPNVPVRHPILCTGCPHRSTYISIKLVYQKDAIYSSDIGCYTLGVQDPIEMTDLFTSMGASISSASGLSLFNKKPVIAFIGDSTFYHSGMTGLVNAVYNNHNFLLVVLDNHITAMTGMQKNPGVEVAGHNKISIENIVRACGVEWCKVIDPNDAENAFRVFNESKNVTGVRVIIARSPCALMQSRVQESRTVYQVDSTLCKSCNNCHDTSHCATNKTTEYQFVRVNQLLRHPRDNHPKNHHLSEQSPCVKACPVDLCAQGYVTELAAGDFNGALNTIRDQVPFPYSLGSVCHAPCEKACEKANNREAVQIRELKKFATQKISSFYEDQDFQQRLVNRQLKKDRIAIIGAGPSGIACAYDLLLKGYSPEIYEADSIIGGMMALGIPPHRMCKETFAGEIRFLISAGIRFYLNTRIGTDIQLDDIYNHYDAVYVAIGQWQPKLPVSLRKSGRVISSIRFFSEHNRGQQHNNLGHVILTGDVRALIDISGILMRQGVSVTIVCSEGDAFVERINNKTKWPDSNRDIAVICNSTIDKCHDTETGVNVHVHHQLTNITSVLQADYIISASGQKPDISGFEGLEFTENGHLLIHPDGSTNRRGLFAGGDVTGLTGTVVDSMGAGKKAATEIHKYLSTCMNKKAVAYDAGVNLLTDYRPQIVKSEIAKSELDESAIKLVASKCDGCSACNKCDLCFKEMGCPAISMKNGKACIDDMQCTGCGYCAVICPNMAIKKVIMQ